MAGTVTSVTSVIGAPTQQLCARICLRRWHFCRCGVL